MLTSIRQRFEQIKVSSRHTTSIHSPHSSGTCRMDDNTG